MLPIHELCRFNFLLAGDEVIMPKQHHAFRERRGGGKHFLIPPATHFHTAFDLLALELFARFIRQLLEAA